MNKLYKKRFLEIPRISWENRKLTLFSALFLEGNCWKNEWKYFLGNIR